MRDADGNYIALNFWNDLNNPGKPGLSDDDLAKLAGFNQLKNLRIHRQRVTAEGVKVVERLPALEVLRFQYMSKARDIDASFMLVANAHQPRLKTLGLKHLFDQNGTRVDDLGVFPKLEHLVLDNESAEESAVEFIARNPSVTSLELHRSKNL